MEYLPLVDPNSFTFVWQGVIMQIGEISKVGTSKAGSAVAASPPKPLASSSVTTVPQATPADTYTPSSLTQAENPAGKSEVTTLAASYSTTVAGENFKGSVEESEGTYVASVPAPPGASASGSSVQAAENNLNIILSTLV